MSEKKLAFNLAQHVVIACSGESGTVIGRAQYLVTENQYQVRYRNSHGVAVEQWWAESALSDATA